MKKIIGLMLVIMLVVFGCEAQNQPAAPQSSGQEAAPSAQIQPTNPNPPPGAASSPSGAPVVSGTKEISMRAFNWGFDPAEIKVKKGDKVKLLITSTEARHGFSIDSYGLDVVLEPGMEVPVEFVADKSGTFSFYCSVFCGSGHRGMKGTLVVE